MSFHMHFNMWKAFLDGWNGCSFFLNTTVTLFRTCVCIPMLPVLSVLGKWFQGRWPPHMHLNKDRGISIEWRELFSIVVACAI